ncbi:hypothetical protein TWF788_008265 [Orbilia oligospora]|uniref:Uncharacterized protein n=1 Tax=Orbilia oligospora TaxID=2813651 RepID=A0A7C8U3V5_ORBOL|nr:hypothetical protein TWF788_008265 [Orbilia oligospora]
MTSIAESEPPKIRRPSRNSKEGESYDKTLIQKQFQIEYYNIRTEHWTNPRFESVARILRIACAEALNTHRASILPILGSLKKQSDKVIQTVYDEFLKALEARKEEITKNLLSIIQDMITSTELPSFPKEDKWLFFWVAGTLYKNENRKQKAKKAKLIESSGRGIANVDMEDGNKASRFPSIANLVNKGIENNDSRPTSWG